VGLFSPAPKDFDMAINEITITPERSKVVDFSVPASTPTRAS
jgi:hypothetical protein